MQATLNAQICDSKKIPDASRLRSAAVTRTLAATACGWVHLVVAFPLELVVEDASYAWSAFPSQVFPGDRGTD